MSTHTPGPWSYSRSEQFGYWRFYVAQAEGAPYTPHYSDVATLIAETVSDERRSIQEANAQLIAAAPDLLELLREAADYTRHPDYDWPVEFSRRVSAAFAKATGGEV